MRLAFGSTLFSTFLILSTPILAKSSGDTVLVSIGTDAVIKLKQQFREDIVVLKKTGDTALIRIPSKDLVRLSQMMHETFGRCGGFVVESNDVQEAIESLTEAPKASRFSPVTIRHQDLVRKLMALVQETNIRSTIQSLSRFRNRLYSSQHGVHSQEWVGAKWQELTRNIPNTSLEFIEHSDYPQRSVILTITGSKKPNEIVVVGGHGDSISGWSPSENTEAPGADDNASGISSITEAIRILGETGIRPERTIKFMSYAAEEIGLRGSNDIASSFKDRNENVIGVMQLDMTNYTTRNDEVVLMTDHTNAEQNEFLKNLMRTYLPAIIIMEDVCGYACSDHASWTRYGFPASIPFEARMSEYNHAIHTSRDTLAMTQNMAAHSVPYSKLLLSYIIELGLVD